MRKIFIFLLLIGIFSFMPTYSEVILEIRESGYESPNFLINKYGEEILKSSKLPTDIVFEFTDQNINFGADMYNIYYLKKIQFFYEVLDYTKNDEEIKAILSHKIGVILNSYNTYKFQEEDDGWTFSEEKQTHSIEHGKNYSFERLQAGKKDFESDLSAVDIMICSDINPLSLISVLYQVKSRVQSARLQDNATLRALKIYDYISYNFPEIIENGYKSEDYQHALVDIQKLISKRSAEEKRKVEEEQAKIKKDKIKKAKKTFGKNAWNSSYVIIKNFKVYNQTN